MAFLDNLMKSVERQSKMEQTKARISYANKLSSAYENTDDSAKKREISKKIRENAEELRKLK